MRTSVAVITEVGEQSAMVKLQEFVAQRKSAKQAVGELAEFERKLHEMVSAVECEAVGEELKKFDIDVPTVKIGEQSYKQVLRSEETYLCAGGQVRVERSLYRANKDERAIIPMEMQAGIVGGFWTPRAAEIATWSVSEMTPGKCEKLFEKIGGMKPCDSSLDRLVKEVGQQWEQERENLTTVLQQQESIPEAAVSCAVSLDGVMVALRDGERTEKRAVAQLKGKRPRGPAGYGEAGCGTISFYDKTGQLISTLRLARMPESGKTTLKQMLKLELESIKSHTNGLRFVAIADGAPDNWTFLDEILPSAAQVVDFYHASEHLKNALDTAYGENSSKSKTQFEKLRHKLRHHSNGVNSVIRALLHLRDRFPRRLIIARELAYFRKHQHRMRYAEMARQALPIGSGIVEAACKTLVTQRLKCSGMRWRQPGGQSVLTFRALIQSDRFDRGWDLLMKLYKTVVSLPDNVLSIPKSHTRASI